MSVKTRDTRCFIAWESQKQLRGFGAGGFLLERIDGLLELADLDDQVWEAAEGGLLAEGLAMGQGGDAADHGFWRDIVGDGGAGGDHGTVANGLVIADGDLSAENYGGAEGGAAGESGLTDDDAVRADDDVVPYLDEIVDFGAMADARHAELGAVDADAGADLHIILNNNGSDLRDFGVLGAIPAVAKAVGA